LKIYVKHQVIFFIHEPEVKIICFLGFWLQVSGGPLYTKRGGRLVKGGVDS